jgi:membrane associated rhomboid family serine protease
MLFLPLGLFTRIYRFPWATLLLLIVTIAVSFQNFETVDEFEKIHLRSEHQFKIIESRLQWLNQLCLPENLLNAETCGAVRQIQGRKISSFLQPVQDLGKQFASGKNARTDAELAKFQNYVYSNIFLDKYSSLISVQPSYSGYLSEKEAFDGELNSYFKKHHILSKGNLNPVSLLKAQFIHAGYMHLFGNLAFFLFLSIFVELRLGFALYLIFYLLTGAVGLGVHILSLSDSSIPLLGASANISGIAGGFTVFFWKKRLKVLGSLGFVYNRIFALPVSFFFPVLVFSGDLAGSLDSRGGGVAHLAHLMGFLCGAACAFVIHRSEGLPVPFTFSEELSKYQRNQKLPLSERLPGYLQILKINPENTLVHSKILSAMKAPAPWSSLGGFQKVYASQELPVLVGLQKGAIDEFTQTLNKIHPTWPLKKIFHQLTGKEVRALYEACAQSKRDHAALILLKVLFSRYPNLQSDLQWNDQFQKLNELNRKSYEQSA